MKWLILPAIFVFTGVTHLLKPEMFAKIVPPILPFPYAIAILSGVAELALAAGLAWPRTRKVSGYVTALFLLAIFPANVYMWMRPDLFPDIPEWALLARLPLQVLLIWWALSYTKSATRNPSAPYQA